MKYEDGQAEKHKAEGVGGERRKDCTKHWAEQKSDRLQLVGPREIST